MTKYPNVKDSYNVISKKALLKIYNYLYKDKQSMIINNNSYTWFFS